MKKILWLGSYITENCIDELNSMGFNKASTYISQKNILEGLEQNTGFAFDSIGAVVLPDYPKCRTLIFQRKEMFHSATSKNILVRYLNLKYINKLSTNLSLVHEAKKWAKMNQGNQVDIFIYEMRSGCMKAACSVKKNHSKCTDPLDRSGSSDVHGSKHEPFQNFFENDGSKFHAKAFSKHRYLYLICVRYGKISRYSTQKMDAYGRFCPCR